MRKMIRDLAPDFIAAALVVIIFAAGWIIAGYIITPPSVEAQLGVGGHVPATNWASPGAIGSTTPNTGKFTTVESTIATGTAPLVVASTTNVVNLNASSLSGATFAAPGTIGGGTPAPSTFTTMTANTSVTIGGATPTAITNIRVYTPSLTPAQLAAAIGVTEEAFTVTGLTTADKVFVNGPAPTALCPPVTYRVSAADTLAIGFVDLTVALCTPAAGTYAIVAVRS